jgi:TetR/AcrR family transcriptional repressor of nem operon
MPRIKLFDKDEVLERAMLLFWKQGYSATSMQDLVTHLGINRASMYDTFGGKKELFKKALEHYRKTNTTGLQKFFNSHPNVKQGMEELFQKAINETLNDQDRKGCFVVNTTTELLPGDEILTKELSKHRDFLLSLYESYLEKGQNNGQIKTDKDIKALANLFFLLYNGIKVVGKSSPEKESLLKGVQTALSLLE